MVTASDIARYNAVYVTERLDDAEVFRLPEEHRLLFALKQAGRHSITHKEPPIGNAPIASAGSGEDTRCAVLEGWIDDLKTNLATVSSIKCDPPPTISRHTAIPCNGRQTSNLRTVAASSASS